MIKVAVSCNTCGVQHSVVVDSRYGTPRWGTRLWKSALNEGWSRNIGDHTVYCKECKDGQSNQSTVILPVAPIRMITFMECRDCSRQFAGSTAVLEKNFARDLRKTARPNGWRQIQKKNKVPYDDYCSTCFTEKFKWARRSLMRLVWSQSTIKVAKILNVSDSEVGHRCSRIDVPKPPPGYWSKWNAGKKDECRRLVPVEVVEVLGEPSFR